MFSALLLLLFEPVLLETRQRRQSRVRRSELSQRHSSLFRLAPQCGHSPRQSLRQITFMGIARRTCSASTSARNSPSPSKKAISVSSSFRRNSSSRVIDCRGR